ncbi:hypothetical protein [Halomicrobium mukohataei]|uniref:hypothetical protein n=1 Tax=Halomicrobium mukohataei TaxID=57705 RepID=UPI000F8E461D|nr:hypothetical protein [Halomicrobium mukohataei]
MSTTRRDGGSSRSSVSVKIDDEFLEEFDRELKKAQIEGKVKMDVSRSEAIRRLMKAGKDDMDLISDMEQSDDGPDNVQDS